MSADRRLMAWRVGALAVGCLLAWATASATSLAAGQWEVTARALTPQGFQTIHETVCQRSDQIDSLLMREQGAQCQPWVAGAKDASGFQSYTAQCVQQNPALPGLVLPFSVEAKARIAPDGRRVEGTVVARSTVSGFAFDSPATPFSARFVRSSCGKP
ncbi:hypothetical protein [Halothiobacillus sp. DCM-1]|uniref:hypothetical protein n=1 Tax=Halothiobacillus sp. DCM-1 TaxID=3112558 RepID=UPI00324E8C2F